MISPEDALKLLDAMVWNDRSSNGTCDSTAEQPQGSADYNSADDDNFQTGEEECLIHEDFPLINNSESRVTSQVEFNGDDIVTSISGDATLELSVSLLDRWEADFGSVYIDSSSAIDEVESSSK